MQLKKLFFDGHTMDDPALVQGYEQYVKVLNTNAMKMLSRDKFDLAKKMLDKAKRLTEDKEAVHFGGDRFTQLKWLAITLTNMGCYYKRRRKLWSALNCLHRALQIEMRLPSVDNPAATHLNLCATLSELGRHRHALQHAQLAVHFLETCDNDGDRMSHVCCMYVACM